MTEGQKASGVATTFGAIPEESEGEVETVLFDGCLGLGLSISFSVLAFLNLIFTPTSTLFSIETITVCMTIAIAIFLALSSINTNQLQTKVGFRTGIALYIVGILGSLVTSHFGLGHISIVLAALNLVSSVLIYAPFLIILKRGVLIVVIDVIVIFAGVLFLLFTQLNSQFLLGVRCFIAFIAMLFTIVFCTNHGKTFAVISKGDSKDRSIKTKGNKHTLFLDGFLFSASLGIFSTQGISIDLVVMTIGTAFCLAGIFSSIIKNISEKTYIETIQKSMALTSTLLIVAVLTDGYIRLAIFGVYIFIMSLHLVTATNAVIETARFNIISPIWILGKEGGIFFAGIATGSALFGIAGYFITIYPDIMIITCVTAVIIASFMQIQVNYQIYPFTPIIENDNNTKEEIEEQRNQSGKRKALWQLKCKAACEEYRLSPREREVLMILLRGRDARYIMNQFYISQSTAKTHIYNIYKKFGVHSRQDLIDFVEEIQVSPELIKEEEIR